MRVVVTVPDDDEFFRFLAAEGLVDDQTIPSGTDRSRHIRWLVETGALAPDVLAAARARFDGAHTVPSTASSRPTDTPPAVDPLIGKVLGGCRVEKLLGAGGMGAVYLATQLSIDRPVALKVQKGIAVPELVERFRSEARTLGRLHSPHIVDVYEIGAENGLQFFVMQFMPGGSMTHYSKKQPEQKLGRADARRMLIECSMGLAEASAHGVLHRDIKPDNLLLDARGTVKIADFGIAKLLDAEAGLTQTGFSPGTPAFKSPEQVAASELDFRTDMYSLGVSFWMLMTGARPADTLTRSEALERMPEPPAFSAPELPLTDGDPLLVAICRMMALKRNDRFASWQELIDTLQALPVDGGPVAATEVAGRAPVAAPVRRTPGRWLAAAAVVVVGAAAVGLWYPGGTPEHPSPSPSSPGATSANENDTAAQPPSDTGPKVVGSASPIPGPAPGATPTQPKVEPAPPQQSPAAAADAAARQQFLAELGAPLPTSPRTAAEVDAQLQRLRAQASKLQLADDAAWTQVAAALERESAAATQRDELRRTRELATFADHERLAAAAQAIELPAYRQDCVAHVQSLFDHRPKFLRLEAADLAWLQLWLDWDQSDANTSEDAGRPLPRVVRDRRRGCAMVLLVVDGQPSYLDADEVSLGQWRTSGRGVVGLQGPDDDRAPVRNVDSVDVDAFLAASGLRLPTVAELRAALGTRDGDRYWWGNAAPPPANLRINLADRARHEETPTAPYLTDCDDGVAAVAAVDDVRFVQGVDGQFHHLLGNVAEACDEGGQCVVLGGSYLTATWDPLQAAQRTPVLSRKRQDIGFRGARTVGR